MSFAAYEDFAHLLEEGAEQSGSKEKKYLKKRSFNQFNK